MSRDVVEGNYDIIFAGGGATACITAGRLAAADPSLKILILEDGPGTRDKSVHVQPARAFANLLNPASETVRHNIGRPSEALANRCPLVSTGRCLGGGSSVNLVVYARASASDYDDWESAYKNPGWGSKDLIPLLRKAETFDRSAPNHGFDGPIKVSYRDSEINIADDFLDVAGRYDKERPFLEDTNNFFSCNGYGRWAQYIDPASGRRSDAAHHYIYNQVDNNQNLIVFCGKRVVRILFEGTKATGVEYVNGSDSHRTVAKASRLVVVSAGALGTPTLLQRSGIGNPDLLKKHGVKQLVDLPGVGEHYMDHTSVSVPYIACDDAETMDTIFLNEEKDLHHLTKQWIETGKGLLAHNGLNAGIKMRPQPQEAHELGREFESTWSDYFMQAPDKPVIALGPTGGLIGRTAETPHKKFLSMLYFLCYPRSLGFVRISSGTDSYAPVDFHPGFLDAPADVGVLRWAYKKAREIARRMKMYRGEYTPGHPKFPKGSAAECKSTNGPVDIGTPNIVYDKEDDDAIDVFHRERAGTTWHSMGTCAMKPREDGGVVDSRLNVYGTQCLKVADCSIAPANVGANTYNTAIAIGEKAAVLIAEELGIKICSG